MGHSSSNRDARGSGNPRSGWAFSTGAGSSPPASEIPPMKIPLILGFGCVLAASGALAQAPDVAAFLPFGSGIAAGPSPLPQFIQQDLGRSGVDRDRGPRGDRMDRDDDDDRPQGREGWRARGPMGGLPEGRPGMMRPPGALGMMAHAGARFHMRKGDAAIDVRCPSDVRLNECVDAIGRVLDRLSGMGTGQGAPAPAPVPR